MIAVYVYMVASTFFNLFVCFSAATIIFGSARAGLYLSFVESLIILVVFYWIALFA